MKLKLIAVAVLAALTAVAMPTNEQIAQANKDVQASLKKQIAAWQSGDISDGDLAALMLSHAGKFKDEPRHYACLQAAFAAAVRAGDAAFAARVLKQMRSEVDGFSAQHEKRVMDKALATTNGKKAATFRRSLTERFAEVGRSTAQIELAEHMKRIVIPVLDFKPPTTLPDVITYLRQQSIEHGDPTQPKGERGIPFLLKGNLAGRAVPKLLAKNISLYDALNLVCQSTETSFFLQEGTGKVIAVIESTRAEDVAGNGRSHNIRAFRPPVPRTHAEIGLVGRMKRIMIPSISFKPPATVADAIEFFRDQSVEHDDPTLPKDKRGIRFILKGGDADKLAKTPVPKLAAKNLSLYNVFNLVCEVTGLAYRFGKQQEIVIESLK
ncbi:MAG: hypothetical protein IJL17_20475 [Kiritimatiellae bacterium]|nr:hypothetical protein [Kiritimatiellia bacterium]